MKKYISLAALFIFTLTGCKKDADLATPDRKIVVDAQISPTDDTIKIVLEYSKPINAISNTGNSNNYLRHDIHNEFAGAEVTLSDGATAKTLKRDSSEGVFKIAQADFPLIPGKTYYLHVKNNNQEVSAQTTIPYAVTNAVYIFLGKQPAGSYKSRYTNRFVFTDSLNLLHYYRLYSSQKPENYFNELLYGNYLIEEKSFTGEADIIVETIEPPLYYIEDSLAVTKFGYFFSCSYEYFQFYRSIENTKGLSNTPELLEEPVNIYTNIQGGLGIFAGCNFVKIKD